MCAPPLGAHVAIMFDHYAEANACALVAALAKLMATDDFRS